MFKFICLFILITCLSCNQKSTSYDTIIRNGIVYDGNGNAPVKADIGVNQDTIAFIGDLSKAKAKNEINANGNAVSPGFINMLSWAVESLIEDGKSQSDLRQGVTLEVFGEGASMGPYNAQLKEMAQKDQPLIKYNVDWNTLGEFSPSVPAGASIFCSPRATVTSAGTSPY